MATQPSDHWLLDEIKAGIKRLNTLVLDQHPPSDAINATAAVWYDTIRRRGSWTRDATPRFRAAFDTLCATCRRWPAPADLLASLPRTITTAPTDRRLMSDTGRERGMRALSEIASQLKIAPRGQDAPQSEELSQ